MKEKDMEQKLDDALRLFDLCQKQVAVLNADCQKMMKDLKVVVDSIDGRFAVQDSSMDVKKLEIEEVSLKINKRLDKDKREMLDDGHKKQMKLEQHEAASKACLLNLYSCLSYVRKEPPSEKELEDLKKQIEALGK